MIIYRIGEINVTPYIINQTELFTNRGKRTDFSLNNITLKLFNDGNFLSPDYLESLLYDDRDDYSEITVKIYDEGTNNVFWNGIVKKIDRLDNQEIHVHSTEIFTKILEAETFEYNTNDNYTGDQAFAGSTATPAEHMLAIIRRYIPENAIDEASFLNVEEKQKNLSIQVDCNVSLQDKQQPLSFLKEIELGISTLYLIDSKIFLEYTEPDKGDLGVKLTDDVIISINKITKTKKAKTYSRYSIKDSSDVIHTGSNGVSGDDPDDLTATYIEDLDGTFTPSSLIGQYIEIDDGANKAVFYINNNSKTRIYIDNSDGEVSDSTDMSYVILQNNNVYTKDYGSTAKLKLGSGASAIGTNVLLNQSDQKLQIELEVPIDFLNDGDMVNINYPEEGIYNMSFKIEKVMQRTESEYMKIQCIQVGDPLVIDFEDIVLTSSRNETVVNLDWTLLDNAYFYEIHYSTSQNFSQVVERTTSNSFEVTGLKTWLGYYFWVYAYDINGIRSDKSNVVFDDRTRDSSGYIDGTEGYSIETYNNWGLLEDYHFLLTYKVLGYEDIAYLQKTKLVILDRSQRSGASDISNGWASETLNDLTENVTSSFRGLGYADNAGVSDTLVEFVDDTAKKIKNPTSLSLRIGNSIYTTGQTIADSSNWFLTDTAGDYYTYWFGTGYMLDLTNQSHREWFKTWKIDRAMGHFESGDGTFSENLFTASSTFKFSSNIAGDGFWENDQWIGYYVYFPKLTGSDIPQWYKITDNDVTTLTIAFPYTTNDYELTGGNAQQPDFIISDNPSKGFNGIFGDDTWDTLYQGLTDKGTSETGSVDGVGDSIGATWVTDASKSWTANQFAGMQISTDSESTWYWITDNTATTINYKNLDGSPANNPDAGQLKDYVIKSKFEIDNGITYGDAMAYFLGGESSRPTGYTAWTDFDGTAWTGIIEYIERVSEQYEGSTSKLTSGIYCLNTWCIDWENNYPKFVDAVNERYQHFTMQEAIQATWDASNEVSKQYIVNDWGECLYRYSQMKIEHSTNETYIRILLLSYPHSQQMVLASLGGALMLTRYSTKIEDLAFTGNIVLNQLYYDMSQAKNNGDLGTGQTIGVPLGDRQYAEWDRYRINYRDFGGAVVFFNPSRKIQKLEYSFDYQVCDYNTGQTFEATTNDIFMLPRSTSILYKNNTIGVDAYNYLENFQPFTYVDCNACWIVFTAAGATAVSTNSVWLSNGHSSYSRFIVDGSATVPTGDAHLLFHAGDGSTTSVSGTDASTEVISGNSSVETLTDKTIFTVVRIYNTTDAEELTAGENEDYLIEFCDGDNSETGKGEWDTRIWFNNDYTGKSLTVYYYSQGKDGEGYPNYEGYKVEHGIIYRDSTSLALHTGFVDYADCVGASGVTLTENTHYYIIPEPTRWKWDYRKPVNYYSTITINTNDLIYSDDNKEIKKIQWGDVDTDNLCLVNDSVGSEFSVNGSKASYSTKTVTRPKVLVYGFDKDPRNDDFSTIAIASREYNKWRMENLIDEFNGIKYDEVVVTGYYDGQGGRGSGGEWGSIQGYLTVSGKNYIEAASYFDAVIICDNFLEGSASSPSGDSQYCSWLDLVDYRFLKQFMFLSGKVVIDRRFGATAFVWYGGAETIKNRLFGESTSDKPIQTSLVDEFGVYAYNGISFSDITSDEVTLYSDENGKNKLSSDLSTDYRVFENVDGVTDHYILPSLEEGEDIMKANLPIYNQFEQGTSFLSYVSRCDFGDDLRHQTKNINIPSSKVYVRKYNYEDGSQDILSTFLTYEKIGRANIPLRIEPALTFNRIDGTILQNNFFSQNYFGTQVCNGNLYAGVPISKENFTVCPLGYEFNNLTLSNWIGKYFRYEGLESISISMRSTTTGSSERNPNTGLYIDNVLNQDDGSMLPFGGIREYRGIQSDGSKDDIEDRLVYDERQTVQWNKAILFNNYYGAIGDENYRFVLSKLDGGFVPYKKYCFLFQYPITGMDFNENTKRLKINYTGNLSRNDIYAMPDEENNISGVVYLSMYNTNISGGAIISDFPDFNLDCYEIIIDVANIDFVAKTITIPFDRAYYDDRDNTFLSDKYTIDYSSITGYLVLTDSRLNTADTKERQSGYMSNITIATTFQDDISGITDDLYYDPDNMSSSHISLGTVEKVYNNRIHEFAIEYNTGLCTGYAFFGKENDLPSCVVWSGVGEADIHRIIDRKIGTTIEFTDVTEPSDGQNLYVYYNQKTDMLQIYESNIGNAIDWPFKFGTYNKKTIFENIVRDYFTLNYSLMDDEHRLG